jgi:hypothetical protein
MKPELTTNAEELIARFGSQLAERFDQAIAQVSRSITNSDFESDRELRAYLEKFNPTERSIQIAQIAVRTFIHDFMSVLDDSDDFKIIGTTADGNQFDLRDLCPEGLHGNQLDWMEKYSAHEDVIGMLIEKSFEP